MASFSAWENLPCFTSLRRKLLLQVCSSAASQEEEGAPSGSLVRRFFSFLSVVSVTTSPWRVGVSPLASAAFLFGGVWVALAAAVPEERASSVFTF